VNSVSSSNRTIRSFFLQVVGDTSGPIMGSHLSSLLENTKKHKKAMGDSFMSVEHMLLAFFSDKRFGQKLFRDLQLTEEALKDAVNAIRGSQRVTDPSMYMRVCIYSFKFRSPVSSDIIQSSWGV